MTLSQNLADSVANGVNQIGQIAILANYQGSPYALCHWEDRESALTGDTQQLTFYSDPFAAQELAKLSPTGEFRFLKSAQNLNSGWIILLNNIEGLRQALDLFYPAAFALWNAQQNGLLRIEDLRPKLERQTGMYRWAHKISDQGAHQLIAKECQTKNCAKSILWSLAKDQPLDATSLSSGNTQQAKTAIPLLCQEACNHIVSKARKIAKTEADQAKSTH